MVWSCTGAYVSKMTLPSIIVAFSVGWSLHSILIGLGPFHNLISSVGSLKNIRALYLLLWGWLEPLLELLLDRTGNGFGRQRSNAGHGASV
jgi:hypothetical protein